MTRAVVYCRISLDATGKELGVQRQESECRQFCASRGWEVATVLVDNDISAMKGKPRPAFEELLATAGNYDAIVVWHTDRLVRLTKELERVIDLGVDVHAVTAGHLDLSTPSGRAVARTLTAWASFESEQKSMRQQAMQRQRAKAGRAWWMNRPLGYNMDGTLHPVEAPMLAQAYEDVMLGVSQEAIARRFNEAGVLTSRGGPWQGTTLAQAMRKPRNAGLATYKGEVVGEGDWEPVISEPTWQAYMRFVSNPKRGKGGTGRTPTQLLSGWARCGVCGSVCNFNTERTIASGKAKTPRVRPARYQCKSNGGCVTALAGAADSQVIRATLTLLPLYQEHWTGRTSEAGADEQRAGELREEKRNLESRRDELAELFIDGTVNADQLKAGTERVQVRLEQIEGELAGMGGNVGMDYLLLDTEFLWQEFEELDLARRRTLVQAVFEKVTVLPRRKSGKDALLELVPRGYGSMEEAYGAFAPVVGGDH